MFKVNYRSKYRTENYGLGHFGKITFLENISIEIVIEIFMIYHVK